MTVVYIDRIFLLNAAADYLLLLCAGHLSGAVPRRKRYAAAALLGGAYAVAAALPGLELLSQLWAKLGFALLLGLAAFGGQPHFFRRCLVFLAVSAAFGGALQLLCPGGGISLRVLCLGFAACYAALSLLFRHSARLSKGRILPVTAVFAGKNSAFRALQDTGNSLFDPMSGRNVLVADSAVMLPLLPEGAEAVLQLRDPLLLLSALQELPGLRGSFRLLPYAAVGVESGLLPVFRPDLLSVDGQPADLLLAISPTPLSPDGSYQALVGVL